MLQLLQNIALQSNLLLATAILSFLLGVYILFYNIRVKQNWLFFGFSMSSTLWLLSIYLALPVYPGYTIESTTMFSRSAYGGAVLMTFFMAWYLYEYIFIPKKISLPFIQKPFTLPSWFLWCVAIETFVLATVATFTPAIYSHIELLPDGNFIDHFGTLFNWFSFHHYPLVLSCLAIPLFKATQAKGIARKKLIYLSIAYVISFGIAQYCNDFLPRNGIFDYYMWGGIATLPFTLTVAFLLLRYRLAGTQFLFVKVFQYSLNLGAFLLVVGVTQNIFSSFEASYYVASLCGLVMFIITNFLVTEYLFGKTHFGKFQQSIQSLITAINSTRKFRSFLDHMHTTFVEQLRISKVEVFLIEENTFNIPLPNYPKNELIALLVQKETAIARDELESIETEKTHEELRTLVHMSVLESEIIFPLTEQKKIIGFLSLGAKQSKEAYTEEEIKELQKLANTLGVFINVLSLEHLGQTQQQELERTASIREKNKYAQRLMHDMKNTLQATFGVINDIQKSQQNENMALIEQSLWDIEDTLNEKENVVHYTYFDIKKTFAPIFNRYKELAKEKKISIETTFQLLEKPLIFADRKKLKRILENLLHNAWKFTPENNSIRCLVTQTTAELVIEIENTGVHIPPNKKEIIFEENYTSDSLRGSGHGLNIVKNLVTLHNGSVRERGKTTTQFQVRIPAKTPDLPLLHKNLSSKEIESLSGEL